MSVSGRDIDESKSSTETIAPSFELRNLRQNTGSRGDGTFQSQREVVVSLEKVHKTYMLGMEGVAALRGVSLSVYSGEFVVLLGKSGSGKTSLLNIIGTIDRPTKGSMKICEERVTAHTSDETLAFLRLKRLGFCFQTFNLISSMTALENVELPMVLEGSLSKRAIRSRAVELLSRVGMGSRLDHLPSQLSGGEQQRVTIARAVANRPRVLLLDEPTGDLDSKNSDIVMKLLVELNEREGITMCMVTHDMALRSFAHRVVHMLDGKVQSIQRIPREVRREAHKTLSSRIDGQLAPSMPVQQLTERRHPMQFYKCVHTVQSMQISQQKSMREEELDVEIDGKLQNDLGFQMLYA